MAIVFLRMPGVMKRTRPGPYIKRAKTFRYWENRLIPPIPF